MEPNNSITQYKKENMTTPDTLRDTLARARTEIGKVIIGQEEVVDRLSLIHI